MKQTTFASAAWNHKGKVTRRERFLAEMHAVIPWPRLLALVGAALSEGGQRDALYDSESMLCFAGIELVEDAIPDESTILRFRHLLEEHKLTEAIFAEVRSLLEEKRLQLKPGTIVDATIIAAPPSTKNAEGKRDPEMHQPRRAKTGTLG